LFSRDILDISDDLYNLIVKSVGSKIYVP
jgi:hypothetical protein